MRVTLEEVKQVFENLIQESVSREQVSDWALQRQYAEDEDNLEYDPPGEEKKIWEAISYLTGVDLLVDEHGNYLHSIQNFIDFRNEIGV